MNEHAFPCRPLRFAATACCLLLALARPAFPASPPKTFTDSDGDTYVVRLAGAGSSLVTLDDPDTDGKGPISSIALTGTDATSVLTIAVAKVGDGRVKMGAITGAGAVNIISAPQCDLNGSGVALGGLSLLRVGDVAASANIVLPGRPKVRPLTVSARNVGAMQLTVPSSTLTFSARSVAGGAKISAAVIAAFNVRAGGCAADITTPGRLVSLSVKGGDFTGHIVARSIGTLSFGSALRDSTITARSIGTVLVAGDLVNSLVLAGANLGADFALGGTGANADTFGPGSIRSFIVLGSLTNSVAGAGFTPLDGKFGDANDGTIGGAASRLGAVRVRGQIDSLSRIGAGALPQFVFVNRAKFKPARDARFVSRKVVIPNAPVVTQLDQTKAVPAAVANRFLYTGANAVQTGVAPDAIQPALAAVLHGRVLNRDGSPLPGVSITLLGRPEFGLTHSRADGMFDMAVNGGAALTVRFEAAGFCPVQRRLDTAQQDFSVLGDVVMIGVDPMMTEVALGAGAPMQMHEAAMQTDASGPRHAALMFQPGTSAMLKMPDGTLTPATSLSVRATEFTVGAMGPMSMPGALPANSAYTYCAELSADEADAAGATSVEFDKPVYFYLENFLHFETGIDVPSGFYNKAKGQWEAGPSGRIVKIISITAGAANLDVDGDGNADTGAALTALSITDAERGILGAKYAAGASLWRVPIPHFSAWDSNWPFGPPAGSGPPPPKPPKPPKPNCCEGSIVEVQSQVLGEEVALAGTPFTLNYRSDRTAGSRVDNRIDIPLSGATLPGAVKRIELEVTVAGRTFKQDFPAQPNLSTTFEWDGLDAFGRAPQGRQPVTVRVGNVYDGSYVKSPRFGYNGNGTPITGDKTRQEITLSNVSNEMVGPFDIRRISLGGWTLSAHHVYDVGGRVLYQGDGTTRSVGNIARVIDTVAGTGVAGFSGDGGPAKLAQLHSPTGIAFAPDGSYYSADFNNHRIRKIDTNGIISTYAGTGVNGFSGDGGPANSAQFQVAHIRTGPDGSLYLSVGDPRVRKIDPRGIITTIAGTANFGSSGDDGPAINAMVNNPAAVVALDGTVYLSQISGSVIRAIKPDGTIIRVAGGGGGGDGSPALSAALNSPTDLAIGPDQALWIGDTFSQRLRRVGPDGIITTVAGGGNPASGNGDGGLATLARLNFNAGPSGTEMAHDAKGNVYCTERTPGLIRCIDANGIISTVAGNGTPGNEGDGGPATAGKISPAGFGVGPDGSIYICSLETVRRVSPPLPGFDGSDIAIPSEDGTQLFRFDATGRHLSTVNALTGAVLLTFSYDTDGQLARIVDGDGNVTRIVRTASGAPSAITGPFGVTTTLSVDANGSLASVVDPLGKARIFTSDADGLLLTETDALGQAHAFTYDSGGRLTKDDAPGAATTDLARVGLPNGYFVTATSALGAVGKVQVESLPNGGELRTNTSAAGNVTTEQHGANGTTTVNLPDGTVETTTLGPDPRFGMQAAVETKHTTATPGGKILTTEIARTATLATAGNPLGLTAFQQTTKVNNRTSTLDFDKAAKTFTNTSPQNRKFIAKVDAQGRPVQVTAGNLAPRNLAYDANGRIASMTTGTGAQARTERVAYNAEGLPATLTDAFGQIERYRYDDAGRMSLVTSAGGKATALGYDDAGQLTSMTPPGRAAHLFSYAPDGQIASYTAPDAGGGAAVTAYTYNADGLLTTTALPGGATVAFDYDAGGRLLHRIASGNTTTVTYSATTGNRTSLTQTNGDALTFTYDGSLPTGLTWSGTVAGSVTRTIDNDFRTASQSVNGGGAVIYLYDNDGNPTGIGALGLTRDAATGVISGTQLASVSDTRTLDGFGQPSGFSAKFGGATNLFSATYTRDKLGRVVQSVETLANTAADTFAYAYDADGQLVSVKKNGVAQNTYAYDSNGNRITDGAVTATYDAQDRLTQRGSTSYTYQPGGELLTRTDGGGTTNYTHDALGNLLSVALPGGSVVSYVVDGEGRRIGRKLNGTLVQGFLYADDLHIVAELNGANALVSQFVYGDRGNVPAYMVKGGATYRLVTDERGSVRLVVNASTGSVAQRLDYDAFGNVLLDTAPGFQPFGFAGGLYDALTHLVHFGARDYDPETGRWTRKDPILFAGGDTNLYGYVGNDPINNIDSNGKGRLKQIINALKSPLARALLKNALNSLNKLYKELEQRDKDLNKMIQDLLKRCPVDKKRIAGLYAELAANQVQKGAVADAIVALTILAGIGDVALGVADIGATILDRITDPAIDAIVNAIIAPLNQALSNANGGG